ncbi:MAG: dockerin type I domain-containing protein [Planctomycetota bacterium]|nr:dockerin type I domain-containing protein [Planctomycetota bacterium]
MLVSIAESALGQSCDPAWSTAVGTPGLNSTVWSLASTDEASALGPGLFVGGQFSTAGGASAKNVARWDANGWSPLGTGAENGGTVYAIAVSQADGVMYVGGSFGNMGGVLGTKRIAKWNGAAWSGVGGGMSQNNTGIRALNFFGDDLFAGGFLNEIGGIVAHKLARWNGTAWSALPGDPLGSTDIVYALTTFGDGRGEGLYVGGSFGSAGGNVDAKNVFRWDGSALSALGRGTNDEVEALEVYEGSLYVGGHFNEVYQSNGTALAATKIARWDGDGWSSVGSGMVDGAGFHVWTLAVFDDGSGPALYVGGQFNTAVGTAITHMARWDGTDWSELGSTAPFNGQVKALATFDDGTGPALFAGGTFTTNLGQPADKIAAWQRGLPSPPTGVTADPAVICEGGSATLSASANGAAVDWYSGGCAAGTFVATGEAIVVGPDSNTTYFARSRDESTGCESSGCSSVEVVVLPRGSGDVNGDGLIDGLDIGPLAIVLLGLPNGPASDAFCAADMNGDGVADGIDTGLFVSLVIE